METNTLLGMFPCSTDLEGSNYALLNSEGSLGHLRKWCDKWICVPKAGKQKQAHPVPA